MDLSSQNASPPLPTDTKPHVPRPPKRGQRRPSLLLMLGLGILIGMCLVVALGFGLYWYGYVVPAGPTPTAVVCPPTPSILPLCPTCEPLPTQPPPTATPDFGATATVACSTFQPQFPGTPCP
jgi:hypothetical protein